MEFFLILAGCCAVWLVITVVKQWDEEAQQRSDDQIMADYLRAEDARYLRYELESIDATVQATIDELDRVAAEAQGEIIESRAIEEHSS
jgi:hypothetical protein